MAKDVIGLDIMAMEKACAKMEPYQRADCPICSCALETTPDNIRHCRLCGYQDQYPIKRDLERV